MASAAEARYTGVVVWFNDQKGYGFIKSNEGNVEFFVHRTSIRKADSDGVRLTLKEHDAVEFSLPVGDGKGDKTMAVDVIVTVPNTTPPQTLTKKGSGGTERRNSGVGGSIVAKCYNCGQPGHFSRNCTAAKGEEKRQSLGGSVVAKCYNCGEPGHFSRNCTAAKGEERSLGGACYNCRELGHVARDCIKENGVPYRSRRCYNCGEYGHAARDCTQPDDGFSYVGKSRDAGCYHCGEYGHFSRDCPQGRGSDLGRSDGGVDGGNSGGGTAAVASRVQVVCHNCGERGHRMRVCRNPKKESS